MAYYYMAETNLAYLNGNRRRPLMVLLLRHGIIAMVLFGAFRNPQHAWALGDIGVGLMAWLNIIAILILHKPALLALQAYEAHRKHAQDPQFEERQISVWGKKVT